MFIEPELGGRLNPRDVIGHLLLVWPVQYIEHSPTKFSQPGKPSDVIVVDVVDLDEVDPADNQPGMLIQGAWWRQSKLIATLKRRVGSKDPMLAFMSQGSGTPGYNAPFQLISATGDPGSVQRAQAWLAAHPEFKPSSAQDVTAPALVPVQTPAATNGPEPLPTQETLLERMARQAREGATRLPPTSPSAQPDNAPF